MLTKILNQIGYSNEKLEKACQEIYGTSYINFFEEYYGKLGTSLMIDFIYNEYDLDNYEGNLYHYTNSGGLLGILNSQKLWGTNIKYLNDSEEMENGFNLLKEVIKNLSTYDKIEEREFLEKVNNKVNDLKDEVNIYVTSLAEKGDDLTQWKGYANHCTGYSIEFNPKNFLKSKRKYPHCHYFLKKIIYKDIDKKDQLEKILKLALDNYETGELFSIVDLVSKFLIYTIATFKNEHFHEEKEWRFIYYEAGFSFIDLKNSLPIKFREGYNFIIPYVELDVGDSAGKEQWNLPITKIIVGSKNNFELSKKSIEMICKEKNIDDILIEKSSIPFR